MVFQLKGIQIEDRLANSNKGNVINFLDGALLACGEHALYTDKIPVEDDEEGKEEEEEEEEKAYNCCQIIDIVELRDIPKNERSDCGLPLRIGKNVDGTERFALIRIIVTKDGVKNPKLNSIEYNMMPEDINEAIPTNTLNYIKEKQIVCNAYLFHKDDIKDGKYNPGGVMNAFLVQRLKQNPDSKNYTSLSEYKTFYNRKNYSKRQWDARVAATQQGRKLLGRKGRIKNRTEHIHMPGYNIEIFEDLKHTAKLAKGTLIELEPAPFHRYTKVMRADLSNQNMDVKYTSQILRAIDEPALDQVRLALGSGFGISNPMSVPNASECRKNKKLARVRVGNGVLVRITTCKVEHTD